ncbi:MAG TPA: glycerol-3-phosphate ABC transporter permease, partial [Lactobacillus sp.]|nr:glycerol-3-phosphate ABC transporter permease [Lactobacillus sp.]
MTQLKHANHYFWLILVALLMSAPILIGIWASLLPTADIAAGHLTSTNISLANYVAAIQTTPVLRYMANSFIIAILITAGQLVLCTLAAYAFAFL